jgi:hypothetical protein
MIWDWANSELDFAYPMSLDGHLFDADLIRALVSRATFRDPNELERELHLSRYRASRLMAAFRHSCVVSAPLNVVTDSVANRSGVDPTMAPEALNELFLGGTRIDLSRTDFQSIRGAHQEIGLAFSDPVSNPRP